MYELSPCLLGTELKAGTHGPPRCPPTCSPGAGSRLLGTSPRGAEPSRATGTPASSPLQVPFPASPPVPHLGRGATCSRLSAPSACCCCTIRTQAYQAGPFNRSQNLEF